MPGLLKDLVGVRSRLAEEVIAYLKALAADAATLPKYYPPHLRAVDRGETGFDHIRQTVQFVDDRSVLERWRAEERERLRAKGQEVERLRHLPERARPDDENPRSERDREQLRRTLRWDERSGERFRRAVILGDPGFGKTWLLRYEARRRARQAAEALENQRAPLRDLPFPIFARLNEIKRRLERRLAALKDVELEEILIELARDRPPSERFSQLVKESFETGRAVLLLDAWDEVPGDRQQLAQRLARFARRFTQARILLASRIVSYTGSPIPDAQELELLAFDWRQVEAFVRASFGAVFEDAAAFLSAARNAPQLRGLARIPLMLALMCRCFGSSVGGLPSASPGLPTRRVELYERCLRGLLRDWNIEDKQREEKGDLSVTAAWVDAMLELLAPVAYDLFAEGHEEFSESLLRAKMRPWLRALPHEHELYGTNAASLIQRLKDDGILIATVKESGTDGRGAPLIFLHRTFHEYLAALALAKRTDWLDVATRNVYDSRWHEVLRLLGGTLGVKTPAYVAVLLRKNEGDLLCRPLQFAMEAALEADPQKFRGKWATASSAW